MENIIIRLETPADYKETENMVREAFWDLYKPGCDEHLVVHKLRSSSSFVKELDFIACDGDKIVGITVCSKAQVTNEQGQESVVLSMVVGVLPSHQKRGIGSMLIKKTINEAQLLGFKGIVIFGNPEYYHRFGFKNAEKYNIKTSDGENFEPFMALELGDCGLSGVQGKFFEGSVYHSTSEELELFEKDFPYKEKHVTDTQLK